MRAALSVVVAAVALGLSACGDDDGTDPSETTAAEPTSTTEAEREVVEGRSDEDRARDQAAAEGIVLRAEDLGPEWQAGPAPDLDVDALDADLADCTGAAPEELFGDDPTAWSDLFTTTDPLDDRSLEAEVVVAASEDAARRLVERRRDPAIVECLGRNYHDIVVDAFAAGGDGLRADLEVGELEIEERSLAPIGDEHVAVRYRIPVSASDLDVAIYLDRTTVRVGRVLVAASASNTVEPFTEEVAGRALEAMAARAADG